MTQADRSLHYRDILVYHNCYFWLTSSCELTLPYTTLLQDYDRYFVDELKTHRAGI